MTSTSWGIVLSRLSYPLGTPGILDQVIRIISISFLYTFSSWFTSIHTFYVKGNSQLTEQELCIILWSTWSLIFGWHNNWYYFSVCVLPVGYCWTGAVQNYNKQLLPRSTWDNCEKLLPFVFLYEKLSSNRSFS